MQTQSGEDGDDRRRFGREIDDCPAVGIQAGQEVQARRKHADGQDHQPCVRALVRLLGHARRVVGELAGAVFGWHLLSCTWTPGPQRDIRAGTGPDLVSIDRLLGSHRLRGPFGSAGCGSEAVGRLLEGVASCPCPEHEEVSGRASAIRVRNT